MSGLLTRATVLAMLLSTAGCGGGGGSVLLGGGGIGGTGISSGPITAFGSVFVNGVEYDVTNAAISVNGQPAAAGQADLGLGMVVTVTGAINSDGLHGTAFDVEYRGDVVGSVQGVDTTKNTLTVLGQTVQVDTLTVFSPKGTTLTASLAGSVVEVSGLTDASGVIHATRIEVKAGQTEPAIQGVIENLNSNGTAFTLRGLNVDASNLISTPPSLANGLAVEVYGTLPGSTFVATRIELDKAAVETKAKAAKEGEEMEVEGLVSGLGSNTFTVRGIQVNYGAGTTIESGQGFQLANGAQVEVKGSIVLQNGASVLSATKIEIKSSSMASGNGVPPTLQEFDGVAVLSVDSATHSVTVSTASSQTITVQATSATLFEDELNLDPFNYDTAFDTTTPASAVLRPNDKLDVKGYLDNSSGAVTAVRIERKTN